MTAMKGATTALSSMNRSMNLPALQRIAMEFERENDIMEQRQDIMDDSIDDAMDVGLEEEGDEVVEQVLEEIGVDLNSAVCTHSTTALTEHFQLTLRPCSLEKHLRGFKPKSKQTPESRRLLAGQAAGAAAVVAATTMTSKRDSIVYGSRWLGITRWGGPRASKLWRQRGYGWCLTMRGMHILTRSTGVFGHFTANACRKHETWTILVLAMGISDAATSGS